MVNHFFFPMSKERQVNPLAWYEEEEMKARVAPTYLGTAQKWSLLLTILLLMLCGKEDIEKDRAGCGGHCPVPPVLPLRHSSDTNSTRSPTAIIRTAEPTQPLLHSILPPSSKQRQHSHEREESPTRIIIRMMMWRSMKEVERGWRRRRILHSRIW